MQMTVYELKQLLRMFNRPGVGEEADLGALVRSMGNSLDKDGKVVEPDPDEFNEYTDDEIENALIYRAGQIAENREKIGLIGS